MRQNLPDRPRIGDEADQPEITPTAGTTQRKLSTKPSPQFRSPKAIRDMSWWLKAFGFWLTWLGRHAELPIDNLDPPVEWLEHLLGARLRQQIEQDLGREAVDPYGSTTSPKRRCCRRDALS